MIAILRISLAAVFIVAGATKMLNSVDFMNVLKNLHDLPPEILALIAALLPSIEILLGLTLALDFRYATIAALGLNIIFLLFLSYNYVYGNPNTDCGCFGTLLQSKIDETGLIRQLLIVMGNTLLVIYRRQLLLLFWVGLIPTSCECGSLRLKAGSGNADLLFKTCVKIYDAYKSFMYVRFNFDGFGR